jgi:hypothetical protein
MKNLKIEGPVFNYQQFFNWTKELVAQEKSSGSNPSSDLIKYTALNFKRMERLNKTIQLSKNLTEHIRNIKTTQIWFVITETWCGDSAQSLPVIGKIAELSNDKIELKIILRDLNPQWIEKYHTNGSKSIPKLIAFDKNEDELFTWGPRPVEAHEILMAWKTNPNGKSWDEFELELHTWYSKNKTISTQNEIYEKIKSNETLITNTLPHSG